MKILSVDSSAIIASVALAEDEKLTKNDKVVIDMKAAIDKEYADGRTTLMGDEELANILKSISPKFCAEHKNII